MYLQVQADTMDVLEFKFLETNYLQKSANFFKVHTAAASLKNKKQSDDVYIRFADEQWKKRAG